MALRDTPPGENSGLDGSFQGPSPDGVDWSGIARSAFEGSTNWINSSRRARWGDSLRMFQGEHPSGSKYLGNEYRYRSRLVRPKSRSTIRRSEAAAAQAFFSSDDLAAVTPENEDDPAQQASARLNKELVNYRLTQTIPWFLTLLGAWQDCQIYGFCISRQYWKFEERLIGTRRVEATEEVQGDDQGFADVDEYEYYEVTNDHPDVALIAPDNFRFDPAADWRRPIETSPYLIERMPMYVGDVKEKMATGEWKEYPEGSILAARNISDETTRLQREGHRQDSMQTQSANRDFDVTWVHLNTMKRAGYDWVFFTLGADKLLTDPRLHVEVYGTERRPYRLGVANLEAHRNYPSSKMELLRDLQIYANDTANMRLDAMKLALMPRPLIKAGSLAAQSQADYRVFMPGKPFLVADPSEVSWERPPDPSQAAFEEQNRIDVDFDAIAGGFDQGTVQTNRALNETARGIELIAGAAGTVGEYELRLFAETWVEPVIADLVELEQRLEEDETILLLAGEKAQLYQRYGVSEITDWLLSQRATTKVNVGIGATNPATRIQHLMTISQALKELFGPAASLGLKWDEILSELFGIFGYADGKRFFTEGFDIKAAQAQLAQAQQAQPIGVDPNKLQQIQLQANTQLQKTQMEIDSEERIAAMRYGGESIPIQEDPSRLTEEQLKAAADMRKSALELQSKERIAAMQAETARAAQAEETRRAMMQQAADQRTHLIRTLPPAIAKLISDDQYNRSQERMARLRPNGKA